MRLRLIPRDSGFYDLFTEAAANNAKAAELLRTLFAAGADQITIREQIRGVEHDGDEITHNVMKRINTTFVTPFDREDIYRLASSLDDVLDHMDAAADFLVLHNIADPLPELAKQADVLCEAARVTHEALKKLRTFKDLETDWVEINRLENEGDQIYRTTVATLFSGDFKGLEVLKYKDVVDELENAMDSLEDVANVIESIVLKHA